MQKKIFICLTVLMIHFSCLSMNHENSDDESVSRIPVSFLNETSHTLAITSPAQKNHVALHHSQELPSETVYIEPHGQIMINLPRDKCFDVSTERTTQTRCASTVSKFFRIISLSNRRWKIIRDHE